MAEAEASAAARPVALLLLPGAAPCAASRYEWEQEWDAAESVPLERLRELSLRRQRGCEASAAPAAEQQADCARYAELLCAFINEARVTRLSCVAE